MLPRNLVLSALVTLSLLACSTMPSEKPTVKRQPPASCLTQCDPLPTPTSGSELDTRRWEYQVLETFGLCRRKHADCVDWSSK